MRIVLGKPLANSREQRESSQEESSRLWDSSEGGVLEDKVKGRMKEAYGAIIGDEDKKAEGRAQQRKEAAAKEAAQRAKTRQVEEEAEQAEKERDNEHSSLPSISVASRIWRI